MLADEKFGGPSCSNGIIAFAVGDLTAYVWSLEKAFLADGERVSVGLVILCQYREIVKGVEVFAQV